MCVLILNKLERAESQLPLVQNSPYAEMPAYSDTLYMILGSSDFFA